ncbi:MAG: energy transducer TonB, partial [Gammaproteobacteria bacterium]|nr:energy transducer TonB [Gammaproteobacteria bacterium]
MKKLLRTTAVGILALLLGNNGLGSNAIAEEAAAAAAPVDDVVVNQADTLADLLRNVEQRRVTESREHSRREQRFAREKDQQARMLADAQAERRREEQRSERLETAFEENEIRIGDLQEQLDRRLGSLRELFGVLQQVAGDTRGLFEGSIISAEIPDRGDWLGV